MQIGGSKGGHRDAWAPLEGPNSFIFMQFSGTKLKNNSTFGSKAAPPWKFLDMARRHIWTGFEQIKSGDQPQNYMQFFEPAINIPKIIFKRRSNLIFTDIFWCKIFFQLPATVQEVPWQSWRHHICSQKSAWLTNPGSLRSTRRRQGPRSWRMDGATTPSRKTPSRGSTRDTGWICHHNGPNFVFTFFQSILF